MLNKTIALYRGAYGGLSPSTWLLSLVLLINRSGAMVIPFMTVYLTQHLHFSLADAGLVMACFGAGAVIGAYAGGKLTDTIGFARVQFWSLFVNGLFFILLGQMRSLHSIMLCIFCMASVGEAFRPANASAIAHYSNATTRTRAYSLNRLAINLGFAIGPAIGGILASISYDLLFWVDGASCVVAAFLIHFLLDPSKANKEEHHTDTPLMTSGSAYRDKPYLVFIFLCMINAVCFFQMFTIVPVYFKETLHMNEFLIGICMSVNGLLIALVEMLLIFKLDGKRHSLVFIGYGLLLEAVCFLGFVLLPQQIWVAFLFMGAITFGEMMTLPFMNSFWISRSASHNRGQYAALYTISYSVAHIIAPTLGSRMAQWVGFTNWWLVTSVLCLLTFAGFRWLWQRVVKEA
ncbi:MFS transporter [uncultured Chitinophaga sp.]|uniref:MFS transporter n=1 Tax=uncultured Chitinophaga sp. TaxID=339340 RepID=UPI0025D1C948|nr:MFS transporter [uncultured Chitinophaga sp.]